jgi:hypothetical protein
MSGRRLGLAASLALVILVNALVLAGVARNRSGTPEARVVLTERECPVVRMVEDDEDTGLSLRLTWTAPGEGWPPPVAPDVLRSLGFDVSMDRNDPRARRVYEHALARDAFIVLAESETEAPSQKAEPMQSRLVNVALGRDAAALRSRFPQRDRYLILPVEVEPYLSKSKDQGPQLSASVSLRSPDLYVPLSLRPILNRFRERLRHDPITAPRYRVTLAVGRRHEPWLEKAEPLAP